MGTKPKEIAFTETTTTIAGLAKRIRTLVVRSEASATRACSPRYGNMTPP